MKVIGFGETVLDIIFRNDQPQKAVPGGSTFNAMISLGRMGVPGVMITETGDDHVGDIVRDFLIDNNINTDYVYRHVGTKSHLSLAFLDANNDARYQFYKDLWNMAKQHETPQIVRGDIVI
jgi:fructokinase